MVFRFGIWNLTMMSPMMALVLVLLYISLSVRSFSIPIGWKFQAQIRWMNSRFVPWDIYYQISSYKHFHVYDDYELIIYLVKNIYTPSKNNMKSYVQLSRALTDNLLSFNIKFSKRWMEFQIILLFTVLT